VTQHGSPVGSGLFRRLVRPNCRRIRIFPRADQGKLCRPSGGSAALAALVDSGDLRVHLETMVPLGEAAKAHELVETGRTTGKIVLTI
jgi:NADPH:quinone reductase-like Zn-dependent oxidoreductase